MKNLVLLSSKSAGSSALQRYLQINYGANLLAKTPHHENETLFWSKAASALNKPQEKMYRSVVPYGETAGRKALEILLLDNGVEVSAEGLGADKIIDGYRKIVLINQPLFFEKSPHHLFNWSDLELLIEAKQQLQDDVEIKLVGLIRNPLDTIYSAWSRWKYIPEEFEKEWVQSYQNLRKLIETLPGEVILFRYEDICEDNTILDKWLHGISIKRAVGNKSFSIHTNSVNKWREDRNFGHTLSEDALALAKYFGYEDQELTNDVKIIWPIIKNSYRIKYKLTKLLKG